MSSVHYLREFISERLTAAAEEIFGVFHKTIVQYEEELHRQRRLLDVSWNPDTVLPAADPPQRFLCREEEFPAGQQLSDLSDGFDLDLQKPEPSQIKQEHEEVFINQQSERSDLKEEADISKVTLAFGESSDSDAEALHVPEAEKPTEPPCRDPNLNKNQPRNRAPSQGNANRDDRTVNCDVCGKGFIKASELKAHYRVHTGEKPFSCQTCQKAFTFKSNLRVHMRTHTNETPFSCKTCAKVFKHKSSLLVHMRTHTGEKPYACKTCGKRFTDNSSLKQHQLIHSDHKLHSCPACGRAFRYRSNLLVHMAPQPGEAPITCLTCGGIFTSRNCFLIHSRTHTEDKLHCCTTCGKSFNRSSNLIRHVKIHSRDAF